MSIAQEPGYHNFADQRRIINIANFFNVLSNLPFVIIGIMGMRLVTLRQSTGGLAELRPMYLMFFAGVFLTGFGSAYYHYQPGNQALLWDRLPFIALIFYWALEGAAACIKITGVKKGASKNDAPFLNAHN